jgi:[phosphatase 2A protein]-leucine-carboxy methyltransferase
LHSPVYHLLPADLRRPPSDSLAPKLTPILDSSEATLVLCECVLAYMAASASDAMLGWFVDLSANGGGVVGVIVYEMFGLEDSFGRVMKSNLKVCAVRARGAYS